MENNMKYEDVYFCMRDTLLRLFCEALELRDEINEKQNKDTIFDEGVLMGYYCCLYAISGQLEVFGINPQDMNIRKQNEIENELINKLKKVNRGK